METNLFEGYKVVSIQYKRKQSNCTTISITYFKYSLCQMKNDPCSCEAIMHLREKPEKIQDFNWI